MQGKQNVISYLDLNNSKIIVMLLNGVNTKFAKIEEFDFEKKNMKPEMVLNVLINVLDSFVGENLCKQANYYCVLPQTYSSFEYVKVPNFNLTNTKNFIKPELLRLGINSNDYLTKEHLVLKSKKTTTFKVSVMKKQMVAQIVDAHKKLGLNLKGVGMQASSRFSAISYLTKIKSSPILILDVCEDKTIFYFANKQRLIFSYAMPYGKSQMEKGKTVGLLQNSADACFEVYFNGQSVKNSFAGVQLDIDGESKEKKKLLEKHSKVWKNIQKESGIKVEIEPLIKILSLIKTSIANNGFGLFNEVYVNADNEIFESLKTEMQKQQSNITLKDIFADIDECELKDYLHLLGIIFDYKYQPENVIDVKKFLKQNGAKKIKIISKIENAKGVENAESILDECDGLMVARGDLGVEIPLEKIPPVQKKLVSLCNVKRKFCIVATEMLESMTTSTRPTRAEVSDVASAIFEETNATMLSGETSIGIDPVNVVKTMSKITFH